jgi:glycosyltransferase involved in cell wall biosynthesis
LTTHYLGHFDDDQRLALLYSSADVMVTPSLQEAFGKTLIEAMACGTPVVAFNSGGPVDIIDHRADGYLARPFCADDLADGIAWCLAEGTRPLELGRRGRAKVEKEFDIDVVASRYLALYQQILGAAA